MKKILFIVTLILSLLTPCISFTQTLLNDSCVEIPVEHLRLLLKASSDVLHQDSVIFNLKDQLELTDKIIWEKDLRIEKLKTIIKKERGQQLFFGFIGVIIGFVSLELLN